MFNKGQFQIMVAFSLMPVKKINSQIDFKYVDGNQDATYLVDTVSAKYRLDKSNFGSAINIGIGYFFTDKFRTSINVKPYLNSFLSNSAKNGKVYGVQFDLGLDYFHNISKDLNISFGTTASRIIGGFGITSGGAKKKEYLVVNGNELYDNDIGFHIIDNSWAFSPKIGLHYKIANNIIFYANSGFQMTFGRESRMNFAGLQKDGTVKWNSKEYNDSDVSLTINNTKINNENIYNLPYKFSGVLLELGTLINLNK
ncbi:hypothetical protein [Flavobacterium sp.]|uniref:hypothetical protein n=1 Tax=Flavobacterium sp. TaxID=239 RepID=UPI000EC50FF7|nr:hypothetical protein [Flavobacterium sp.]HCQ12244.1 hypothetical protein [Flavobacterium sp.]